MPSFLFISCDGTNDEDELNLAGIIVGTYSADVVVNDGSTYVTDIVVTRINDDYAKVLITSENVELGPVILSGSGSRVLLGPDSMDYTGTNGSSETYTISGVITSSGVLQLEMTKTIVAIGGSTTLKYTMLGQRSGDNIDDDDVPDLGGAIAGTYSTVMLEEGAVEGVERSTAIVISRISSGMVSIADSEGLFSFSAVAVSGTEDEVTVELTDYKINDSTIGIISYYISGSITTAEGLRLVLTKTAVSTGGTSTTSIYTLSGTKN